MDFLFIYREYDSRLDVFIALKMYMYVCIIYVYYKNIARFMQVCVIIFSWKGNRNQFYVSVSKSKTLFCLETQSCVHFYNP